MKQLLYILPVLFLFACKKEIEKPVAPKVKPAEPVKVEPVVLQEQKAHIDSLFKYAGEDEISIYVKQLGNDSPIRVAAKHFPDNIENTINIFRDNTGRIIRISESPSSESGDWFISCNHYFDEAGKTFAFEKKTNSFDSHCVEGVLYETKTEFFNDKFAPVDYTYKLVDENDRHIVRDSCNIFLYEYKAQPDVDAYLSLKAIPK